MSLQKVPDGLDIREWYRQHINQFNEFWRKSILQNGVSHSLTNKGLLSFYDSHMSEVVCLGPDAGTIYVLRSNTPWSEKGQHFMLCFLGTGDNENHPAIQIGQIFFLEGDEQYIPTRSPHLHDLVADFIVSNIRKKWLGLKKSELHKHFPDFFDGKRGKKDKPASPPKPPATAEDQLAKKAGIEIIHEASGGHAVRYYGTTIVRWSDDLILLCHGGHETNITKRNMNIVSEVFGLGYQVYQQNYKWYVSYDGCVLDWNKEQNVFDEVVLNRDTSNDEVAL